MINLICGVILSLYLMSLPIRVKIKGGADLDAGQGRISFSVFYLPIFRAKGLLKNRSLLHSDLIVTQKKKKLEMGIDVNRKTFSQVMETIKNLELSFLGNLDVKEIYLNVSYGGDDAFNTTMLLGCAKILFYSLSAALKSNQSVEIIEQFTPVYNMRTFKLDFHGIFSLSVADIIYGYLAGKIKKFRAKKTARSLKLSQKEQL